MKKLLLLLLSLSFLTAQETNDIKRLTDALLGPTPIVEDLHELCDVIGGRVTGTEANEASVEWSIKQFQEAEVPVWKESFEMPRRWAEKSATAEITGASNWKPKVACRAFSTGTDMNGLEADLVYVGKGSTESFSKVDVKGKFVLVETPLMGNLTELFLEYINAVEIERNAKEMGALGVVYMSSRAKKLLYRHLTSYGIKNEMPMVVMARDDATRCRRLLKRGKPLRLKLALDVVDEGAHPSYNVVGELKGSSKADEIVIVGAHLDSWGLGTGANDNGCNVNLVIDIARQMQKLNIQTERTIRFVLFNGEEQGMFGSWAYAEQHAAELDKIKMVCVIDIGSGDIDGFFTNGREELTPYLDQYLSHLSHLEIEFEHTNGTIVGTDNYDFFAQGVPNVVGKHDVYNYCADYHSESDTFDKVNQENLKNNTAIIAAVLLGFANEENLDLGRHKRSEVQNIIETQELQAGMEALCLWEDWLNGIRGLKK